MATSPNPQLLIIRWPEVSRITGFRSKSHVENMEKSDQFPRSIKIGPRAKGWLKSEVEAWILGRIAERDAIA
jgi:prophage regulatory protein